MVRHSRGAEVTVEPSGATTVKENGSPPERSALIQAGPLLANPISAVTVSPALPDAEAPVSARS